MFFRMQRIDGVFDVATHEGGPGWLHLADGRTLPFKYAMVVPPFVGADVVKASGLGNAKGFIEVMPTYQTHTHPNVYAVGIATAVNAPWEAANALGVLKTGYPVETMARVAAANIASQIRGQEPTREEDFADIPAVCIMDAGNNGDGHPGRPHAAAAQAGDDPRSAVAPRQARVRALLPVEDAEQLREAALTPARRWIKRTRTRSNYSTTVWLLSCRV